MDQSGETILRLRLELDQWKASTGRAQKSFEQAKSDNSALQKICGEAADIVHLSEIQAPIKMQFYGLLSTAAKGEPF